MGRYEGQLLQGRRHGKGCYFWRGVVYDGQFVDDRIRGEGMIKIGKTSFRGNF
ncbi:MAG: hypothetical protein E6Q36_07775 [Chryseobacterium sp.]|nr:MAG: hypothetical protein E6Q36_07775 [Chryseobacterium sp.]